MQNVVHFVGAGPGDPELITLKAYNILKTADVVLFADSLVPEEILQYCPEKAETIRTSHLTLEEIVSLIKEKYHQGLKIVRLHSGDLSLYSAIHEQITLLAKEGIPCELVPGVSAYQAAAAKLGVELTIPSLVQTVILTRVSGQSSPIPPEEQLATLASHKATLCLHLAAKHVTHCQQELLQHYPPDTPVAICHRVGWPDEKIIIVPLTAMAQTTKEYGLTRHTLYIISPALQPYHNLNGHRSHLYHPLYRHQFRNS